MCDNVAFVDNYADRRKKLYAIVLRDNLHNFAPTVKCQFFDRVAHLKSNNIFIYPFTHSNDPEVEVIVKVKIKSKVNGIDIVKFKIEIIMSYIKCKAVDKN